MQESLFQPTASRLPLVDADIRYYPAWLEQAQDWLPLLRDSLAWQQDQIILFGRAQLIPRLNAWYGDQGCDYSYSGLSLKRHDWTQALSLLRQRLQAFTGAQFNSVLANYYRHGQDSVGWHSDDEPELGSQPVIASLSFGASRRFQLRHKYNRQQSYSLDLDSGSLLLMAGPTQHYWQHQISKTRKPVAERINLTFRLIVADK